MYSEYLFSSDEKLCFNPIIPSKLIKWIKSEIQYIIDGILWKLKNLIPRNYIHDILFDNFVSNILLKLKTINGIVDKIVVAVANYFDIFVVVDNYVVVKPVVVQDIVVVNSVDIFVDQYNKIYSWVIIWIICRCFWNFHFRAIAACANT